MDEKDKRIKKLKLQLAHERRKTYNLVRWVDNVFKKMRVNGDHFLNWRKVSAKCRYSHTARMSAKYRPQPPQAGEKREVRQRHTYTFEAVTESKTATAVGYTEQHARRILTLHGIECGTLIFSK